MECCPTQPAPRHARAADHEWQPLAQTFWHSSSHVLGEALEAVFGADLTIGPAIDDGFYYDCFLGDRTLGDTDKDAINKKISEVCNGIGLTKGMSGHICRLGDARHKPPFSTYRAPNPTL